MNRRTFDLVYIAVQDKRYRTKYRIAKDTGLDYRTVVTAINELLEKGTVEHKRYKGKDYYSVSVPQRRGFRFKNEYVQGVKHEKASKS